MFATLRCLICALCAAVVAAGCAPPAGTPTATWAAPTATAEPAASDTPVAAAATSPAPSATEACRERHGVLEETSYESELLAGQVPLSIYLPPCFRPQGAATRVLYFLHGKPYDESHWTSLGLVPAYERGLARGQWGPAVLVFPRAPEPLFSSSDGGPGSYEAEFIETVMPYVEMNYLELDHEPLRGLAGISRGGIWALEIGLRYPDRFTALAALSPSLAVNYPRPAYDPFVLAQEGGDLPETILLLAGDEDWARPETARLHGILAERGAPAELRIVAGEHRDSTWAAALDGLLERLLEGTSQP